MRAALPPHAVASGSMPNTALGAEMLPAPDPSPAAAAGPFHLVLVRVASSHAEKARPCGRAGREHSSLQAPCPSPRCRGWRPPLRRRGSGAATVWLPGASSRRVCLWLFLGQATCGFCRIVLRYLRCIKKLICFYCCWNWSLIRIVTVL